MMHDSGGPRRVQPLLERLGAKVWDPDRVVVVTDHYLPEHDDESRRIIRIAREWVAANGVRKFHDGLGICHVVLPEQGHLRPGMFVVGGDSHSPTGGAFGAFMFGVGATDMLGVLVTGAIWLKVPDTIQIEWTGAFADGVAAKDVMLFLCARLGMDGGEYQAVEYAGEAIVALPMQERMTLANMTAELGGQTGLIAPDATTRAWLAAVGVADIELAPLADGCGCAAARTASLRRRRAGAAGRGAAQSGERGRRSASTRARGSPQPTSARAPARSSPTCGWRHACCANGARQRTSACRWRRRRRRMRRAARADGTLQTLIDAGAELLPSACGACAGYGSHRFAADDVVISTTARNFRGRMGDASARVYLASPFTVAASAVAGTIVDPREML